MRITLLAGAILTAAATQAAAGPWARGEDRTFLSFSYEMSVDPDDPFLALNHELLFYGERGLSPRLSFVLDGAADITGDERSLVAALNLSLAAPGAVHQVALLAGFGTTRDARGAESFPVVGGSWGRGFDTRWGGGWTTIEAQYRAAGDFRALTKVDLTLGLRPTGKSLVYGQLRLADSAGSDATARLTATLVLDVTETMKAELGLLYGIRNDDMVGVRSGLWLDF